MKRLITAVFLLAISIYSFGQSSTGTLKGTVSDENTGETLPGVYVSVEVGGNMMNASTDIDGKFTIKPLASGTYILKLRYVGVTREYQFEIDPDEITFLNDLTIGNTVMDSVVIVANKLIDPEETSKITIGPEELETSAVLRNPKKLISSLTSDVKLGLDNELYFRGSRSDGVIQFIDGVKSRGDLSAIPGRAIGRVSVYTGGVPAKYGDTTSGVIVMETKSYFQLYYARLAAENK